MIWDNSVHRSVWLTFPAPVDPATASIFPFSRYRLMFLRTGVTYRLVKKRPGSLFMCPFALFSCLIFSNNSLIPCSRIYSASGHCFVCTETSRKGEQWHLMCCFTDMSSPGPKVQRQRLKILLLLSTHRLKKRELTSLWLNHWPLWHVMGHCSSNADSLECFIYTPLCNSHLNEMT